MKKVLKAIYGLVPFKKQIFTVIKTVWKPKQSVYQHLYFKDVFTVPVNHSKKFKITHYGLCIENDIFWTGLTGSWEKESLKLWLKLSETAETIIDIGANTGVYALVARTVNPKAKVYAFEPHPMFFKMLKENIALNGFDIVPFQQAVSNHDDVINIGDYTGGTADLTVQSVALDTFINKNAIKRIDLMKIDVETHEPQVLEGYSRYISQHKPTILIEILEQEIADKINAMVDGLGYLYFNIDEKGSIRQTAKIEKSDYFNYLLCDSETASRVGLVKAYSNV